MKSAELIEMSSDSDVETLKRKGGLLCLELVILQAYLLDGPKMGALSGPNPFGLTPYISQVLTFLYAM